MNFRDNYSQPEIKTSLLQNFRGVDYKNTKFNVAAHRAIEHRNFTNKDGINQKRNGYEEFGKIYSDYDYLELNYDYLDNRKINGVWIFTDTFGEEHTIIHAGKSIYKFKDNQSIPLNELTNITTSTTYNPAYTTLASWKEKITSNIKDEISYGVVKNNRLYIFCGIFLVYGTWATNNDVPIWELRIVEDNIDTYIPTTTIGITAFSSNVNVRTSLEEVNLLSRRRKNKLIGEKVDRKAVDLAQYPIPMSYFEGSVAFANTYNDGFQFNNMPLTYAQSLKFTITDPITGLGTFYTLSSLVQNTQTTITYDDLIILEPIFANYLGAFLLTYKIDTTTNLMNLTLAMGKLNPNYEILASLIFSDIEYQLDTQAIEEEEQIRIKINNENWATFTGTGNIKTYTHTTYGAITAYCNTGIVSFSSNIPTLIEGQSNIIIEFTPKKTNYNLNPDKINKCKFGILFGYNDLTQLFISGNSDYPNMDWHTSTPDITESESDLLVYEDLTYFGDLGYTTVGSASSKIIGYSLLEDNTLAIHKEYSHNESSMFLRTAIFDTVIDLSGNTVYDADNNPLKKVYYPLYASAIGEGVISPYANANLAGDKLILSKNGVYGIVLNSNIKSNERYAKERSSLINNKLTLEPNLSEATAIVYNNKYFLAVGDKVYVADSRYKTKNQDELDDTFSYEWWVWDNIPVRLWFIRNRKLCFGTKDGRLCEFKENLFQDITYDYIYSGAITLSVADSKFIYDANNFPKISNTSKLEITDEVNIVGVHELILPATNIEKIENNRIYTNYAWFYDYIRYAENNIVWLSDITGNEVAGAEDYIITDLNFEDYSFILRLPEKKLNSLTSSLPTVETLHQIGFSVGDKVVYKNKVYELTANEEIGLGAEWIDITNEQYLNVPLTTASSFTISKQLPKINNINITGINEFVIPHENGLNTKTLMIYNQNTPTSLQMLIHNFSNIEAYWVTPIFDLGTINLSKTLHSITIVPETIEHGEIIFGCKTKYAVQEFETEGISSLNFDDFMFNSFSLETSTFARSFTKRIKIKNFNFIQFYFKSNNDRNAAINSISINFTYGKRNKGVR